MLQQRFEDDTFLPANDRPNTVYSREAGMVDYKNNTTSTELIVKTLEVTKKTKHCEGVSFRIPALH